MLRRWIPSKDCKLGPNPNRPREPVSCELLELYKILQGFFRGPSVQWGTVLLEISWNESEVFASFFFGGFGQLVVHWWLGARWFPRTPLWRGLLPIPNHRDPQTTNQPLADLEGLVVLTILRFYKRKCFKKSIDLWYLILYDSPSLSSLHLPRVSSIPSPALKLVFMIRHGHPRKQTLKRAVYVRRQQGDEKIACWQTCSNLRGPIWAGKTNESLCDRKKEAKLG